MVFHKRVFFNAEDSGLAAKQQSYNSIPDWLQSSNPTGGYRIGCVALSPNAGPQPSVEGELQAKSSDRFAICFFCFLFAHSSKLGSQTGNKKTRLASGLIWVGGGYRIRTGDLLPARQAL